MDYSCHRGKCAPGMLFTAEAQRTQRKVREEREGQNLRMGRKKSPSCARMDKAEPYPTERNEEPASWRAFADDTMLYA